jgi:hypothetical protein
MARDHVLNELMRRRAEIAGELAKLERRREELDRELQGTRQKQDSFDVVIRDRDPDARPEDIRPRRHYTRNPVFDRGEVRSFACDVLRDAGGAALSSTEIAKKAMRKKGRDADTDQQVWGTVRKAFQQQLFQLRRRGEVESLHQDGRLRWRLRQDTEAA